MHKQSCLLSKLHYGKKKIWIFKYFEIILFHVTAIDSNIKKQRFYPQESIPLTLIFKLNWDIHEMKILCKFGENPSKNEVARAYIKAAILKIQFFH